ncbi:hypothetical protein AALD01_17280 [Oscillospiraceae bacterium 21-37]
MADIHYTFSEAPVYHMDIRRFQNTDPVNAETVVNPVIQQLIDNIHALCLGKAELVRRHRGHAVCRLYREHL